MRLDSAQEYLGAVKALNGVSPFQGTAFYSACFQEQRDAPLTKGGNGHPLRSFSWRSTSRSTTSRIKAALRFRPTRASMRSPRPVGRRTTVDFTPSGGRPMRV